MIGRLHVNKSGGNVVNGLVEQYLAENETIDANTFVEFVDNIQKGINLDTTNVIQYANYQFVATKINANKILITYNDSYKIIGVICNILDSSIALNTPTLITSDNYQHKSYIASISENKVFITYTGTNYYLCGIVCNVLGETIDVGTPIVLNNDSSYPLSVLKLLENKVLLVYKNTNDYPYAVICTINDNDEMNVYTKTQIVNSKIAYGSDCILVDTNKVFFSYSYWDANVYKYSLMFKLITINEITLSISSNMENIATSNENSGTIYNLKLKNSNDKILCFYDGSDNAVLKCTLCSYENYIIQKISEKKLTTNICKKFFVIKLSNNEFLLLYISYKNNFLYSLFLKLDDTSFILSDEIQLTTYEVSFIIASLISKDIVFVSCVENNTNYLKNFTLDVSSRLKKSTSKIEGLTKSKCTTTQKGDVWLLNNTGEGN